MLPCRTTSELLLRLRMFETRDDDKSQKTVNILLKEKRMGCEDSVREWENYLFWSYKDLTGVLEY